MQRLTARGDNANTGVDRSLPLLKNKKRRYHDKEKSHRIVPLDVLL
jgi:hypothetical protein